MNKYKRAMNRCRHVELQLFADDPAEGAQQDGAAAGGAAQDNADTKGEDQKPDDRKYTDADVAAMMNKWKAEQEASIKAAQEEAAKLAKMNAEQKQKYEMEKLQKENEELKAAAAKVELGKTATEILKEHKIDATQDILDFVVGMDAADTKSRIDSFVAIINAQVKAAEVARATGSTPRSYHSNTGGMSEIDKRIAKYQ